MNPIKNRYKRRSLALFPFWAVCACLLLLVFSDSALAVSTVGTSTDSNATQWPGQRKSFYANGRFWVFYCDGTDMGYRTSSNGGTWGSFNSIKTCTSGSQFSIFFDGTYFHYAHTPESSYTAIYYRRGKPESDGTVTWSADEQTAVAAASGVTYYNPNVSADSSRYPWIGYRRYESGSYYPYFTKASTNNGTWTTASGFPYNPPGTTSQDNWFVTPVPLTSLKVYGIFGRAQGRILGRLYNSGWGNEEFCSENNLKEGRYYSAVAEGDYVHLVYLKDVSPYDIVYRKRTTSWQGEETVQASAASTSAPVLSINTGDNNTLYCFWAGSPMANHVYYKKRTASGWDTDPTDWIDETPDGLTHYVRFTSFYKDYNGHIGLVYMTETSSPYKIRFAEGRALHPMIVWAQDNSEWYPYYSEWNGSTWPNGTQLPLMDDDMQWIVAKANPVRNEKIMVGVNKHETVPDLYASIWNGSNWSTAKNLGDSIETDDYRCFDAAYEFDSGRALVVASVGTSLRYWVWDGSSWLNGGNYYSYDPPNTNGQIFWVKLASKPGSNEIAMIISDDNSDAFGAIWDGDSNSWGNELTLETNNVNYTTESIAVEYIQRGTNEGKAMFVWGAYTSGQYLESRTWNGSGWDAEYTRVNIYGTIKWVTLKADPNSNKLVFTSVDGSNDLNVVIWSGTAWGSPMERNNDLYPGGGAGNTRCADAIFESASGHEGHILLVYSDDYCLRYQHYNGSSWDIGETSISTSYDAYCDQLEQTTNNLVLLAIRDTDSDLNTWKWNNSSWTFLKELTMYLEDDDSTTNMPFMITTTLQPPGTPDITSLDYYFGTVNAPITLYGKGFGYTKESSWVKFGASSAASIDSWTNTKIVARVPADAQDGANVTIDCGAHGSDSEGPFEVITAPPPLLMSFPARAPTSATSTSQRSREPIYLLA